MVEVFELRWAYPPQDMAGVVLVDSVSGLPLPLSFRAFDSAEEAEAFLHDYEGDARSLRAGPLWVAVAEWKRGRR